MSAFVITTAWILIWGGWFQTPPLTEKRAVTGAQRVLVSELDGELPPRPFADWFRQLVGPQAGVNWQLSECGQPGDPGDGPACAEVNALLPDGRKAVVMIAVGTFKDGIVGNPSFRHAAVEQEGELYPVRRLRDLPDGLREPAALKDRYSVKLAPLKKDLNWLSLGKNAGKALDGMSADEVPPPAPPPRAATTPAASPPRPTTTPATPAPRPTTAPAATAPAATAPAATAPAAGTSPPPETRKVSEGVVRGNAIVKAQPIYPAVAKKMQAAGSVQVQVLISEEGRVIEASAISGHPLLLSAAVDAARKWVFKPTKLNGVPVKVQSVLTFGFALTQ
jgi:TonB family protein